MIWGVAHWKEWQIILSYGANSKLIREIRGRLFSGSPTVDDSGICRCALIATSYDPLAIRITRHSESHTRFRQGANLSATCGRNDRRTESQRRSALLAFGHGR